MADEFANILSKAEQQSTTVLPSLIRNSFKSLRGSAGLNEALEAALKAKDKFAFYNKQSCLEVSRGLEEKYKRFADNFIAFGRAQSVSVMEVQTL